MSDKDPPPEAATPPMGWLPSDAPGAGGRLSMAAAARNREPILAVMREVVAGIGRPPSRALELASGSGEHVVAFAQAFPGAVWQPSDRDPAGLASIAAWQAESGLANIAPPLAVDLDAPDWHLAVPGGNDLMVAINLLHIAPWEVTLNLLSGAAALLDDDGRLFVYGCFSRDGDFVSQSNRQFDAGLRRRDPRWGVRDTADVAQAAARQGLAVDRIVPMPANNTVMLFRRDQPGGSG